jgi:hypothetical protein
VHILLLALLFLQHHDDRCTELQVFANFWPLKMLQRFITPPPPPYSPNLSPPGYFLCLKFKIMLKGLHVADVAEIQEVVTEELKKIQNRNFRQLFKNCTTAQKIVYMPMSRFWIKNLCVFLMCLRLKESVLKLLDRIVYVGFIPGYFESDACSTVCFIKTCIEF